MEVREAAAPVSGRQYASEGRGLVRVINFIIVYISYYIIFIYFYDSYVAIVDRRASERRGVRVA